MHNNQYATIRTQKNNNCEQFNKLPKNKISQQTKKSDNETK